MRKSARALALVIVAVIGAITLSVTSAFTAALAFAATALIVPGTGTPNANIVGNYLEQARDRYLTTTACSADGSGCPDANLQGINYPASFFPLVIIPNWCRPGPDGCDTWDDSVGKGTSALNTALDAALNDPTKPGQQVVVFGYSQGGAVVADSLADHINGLSAADKARIQIVTIGGIENPDGGLWQRLAFLQYIPILDISFNPAITPNAGVNITSYGFEYDPVVNAPRYFGNPFALLNALAAFENVHGFYLAPTANGPTDTLPYGYTDATLATALNCSQSPANCRYDQYGNTYVTIPALTLPLADLILSTTPAALRPLVKPFVDLASPVYRVLADLGYDYSGDPSVPTPLSILPFSPTTNPVTVGSDLVAAIIQGIQDALSDVGSTTSPVPAPAPAPLAGPVTAPAPLTSLVAQSSDSAVNNSMPSVDAGEAPAVASSTTAAPQAKTVEAPVQAAEQMTEASTHAVADPMPVEVEKPKKLLVPSMGRSDQLGISAQTPASHDEQAGPGATGRTTDVTSTPPPVTLAPVGSGVTGATPGVTPTAITSVAGAAANHTPGTENDGVVSSGGSAASNAAASNAAASNAAA